MGGTTRVLAVTGGHRYDESAFEAALTDLAHERSWVVAFARQPSAQRWLHPDHRDAFDTLLLYDIPGLDLHMGEVPRVAGPDPTTVHAVADLLEGGIGVVALHHALAGWPAWPGWAEVLGGRFHYRPGRLRDESWRDSGFWHGTFRADPVTDLSAHPVTAGVASFDLDDEVYCAPIFEHEVVPLLRRSGGPEGAAEFRPTLDVILGREADAAPFDHPAPSDLLAWATAAGSSPIVTILPGEHGRTFAEPMYRRLLANAIDWTASTGGRTWARDQGRPIDRTLPQGVVTELSS